MLLFLQLALRHEVMSTAADDLARNRLTEAVASEAVDDGAIADLPAPHMPPVPVLANAPAMAALSHGSTSELRLPVLPANPSAEQVREELLAIRDLLLF